MKILPRASGIFGRVASVIIIIVLLIAGATVSPLGVPAPWGERLSNFTPYLIGGLVGVLILLTLNLRTFSGFFSAVVFGNVIGLLLYLIVPLKPFLFPEQDYAAPPSGFSVLSADLEGSVVAARELQRLIESKHPSIVAVSGVTEEIAQVLREVSIPVVAIVPRDGGAGLGLLATLPVASGIRTEVSSSYEDVPPVILTEFTLPDGGALPFGVIRVPPPHSKEEMMSAELLIRRVFVPLRHERRPYIVAGNLNGTPTSGYYGRLWWATGVRNAMAGFGYPSSCCSDSWWIRIPVNQILYNGAIQARAFEVLPAGSGRINPVWAQF